MTRDILKAHKVSGKIKRVIQSQEHNDRKTTDRRRIVGLKVFLISQLHTYSCVYFEHEKKREIRDP